MVCAKLTFLDLELPSLISTVHKQAADPNHPEALHGYTALPTNTT